MADIDLYCMIKFFTSHYLSWFQNKCAFVYLGVTKREFVFGSNSNIERSIIINIFVIKIDSKEKQ